MKEEGSETRELSHSEGKEDSPRVLADGSRELEEKALAHGSKEVFDRSDDEMLVHKEKLSTTTRTAYP